MQCSWQREKKGMLSNLFSTWTWKSWWRQGNYPKPNQTMQSTWKKDYSQCRRTRDFRLSTSSSSRFIRMLSSLRLLPSLGLCILWQNFISTVFVLNCSADNSTCLRSRKVASIGFCYQIANDIIFSFSCLHLPLLAVCYRDQSKVTRLTSVLVVVFFEKKERIHQDYALKKQQEMHEIKNKSWHSFIEVRKETRQTSGVETETSSFLSFV